MRYTYDKTRHHLTARDRQAVAAMLAKIGDLSAIGCTTGRNKYSLVMGDGQARLTVQNADGQFVIPLTLNTKG